MKTIHPFVKGLLLVSFLLTFLNVATLFFPAIGDISTLERMMGISIYTTFVLTALGVFHTVFFLLEIGSMENFNLIRLFYLIIPLLNLLGIILLLYLLLTGLGNGMPW